MRQLILLLLWSILQLDIEYTLLDFVFIEQLAQSIGC